MEKLTINNGWTLFLDRDGVINRRFPGQYISRIQDFVFLPNVLDTLAVLSKIFDHVIIATNQQGIGKGILTPEQLEDVHQYMCTQIIKAGGCIDEVYYCGDLAGQSNNCRKPSPFLAWRAQSDYPDIDFNTTIMVGDSISDIAFGQNLGMKTVLVGEQLGYPDPEGRWEPDFILEDLGSLNKIISTRN